MRKKLVLDPDLFMSLGGGRRSVLAIQRDAERAADRGEVELVEGYERKFPPASAPLLDRVKAWLWA